jgi:hypothetical protein
VHSPLHAFGVVQADRRSRKTFERFSLWHVSRIAAKLGKKNSVHSAHVTLRYNKEEDASRTELMRCAIAIPTRRRSTRLRPQATTSEQRRSSTPCPACRRAHERRHMPQLIVLTGRPRLRQNTTGRRKRRSSAEGLSACAAGSEERRCAPTDRPGSTRRSRGTGRCRVRRRRSIQPTPDRRRLRR